MWLDRLNFVVIKCFAGGGCGLLQDAQNVNHQLEYNI